MPAVELLVGGLVVLVAALVRPASVVGHREEGGPTTKAEARENTAPPTTAILASDDRQRTSS